MKLAELQQHFIASVLDEDAALPPDWDPRFRSGLAVYRNNYRASLVAALRSTYERSAHWLGESAFDRAAAHHLISHPPNSWTLDDAGAGFPNTLEALFAQDLEVADLARLEWAMHRAFIAEDVPTLDLAGFQATTAAFGEEDWVAMRLQFQPALQLFAVRVDGVAFWQSLADGGRPAQDPPVLASPHQVLVWREDLRPVCRLVDDGEAALLQLARQGQSYGELCAALADRLPVEQVAAQAGALLSRWLQDGLLASVAGRQTSASAAAEPA